MSIFEIGVKIGFLPIDRPLIALRMMIIWLSCSSIIIESTPMFSRVKKRQSYGYYIKNRQESAEKSDYEDVSNGQDFMQNNQQYEDPNVEDANRKNRNIENAANQITATFDRNDARMSEMTRILTFPLSNKDKSGNSMGFAPGNPAGDCLEGGVDAGVINGAVKIGIGFGLAAGCKSTLQKYEAKYGGTEPPPRTVRIPVFIPRPIPVPVAVPQPYPIAIDRPVAIPQPIPFPPFNMGSHHPVMRPMLQFPSPLMTGFFEMASKPHDRMNQRSAIWTRQKTLQTGNHYFHNDY